MAKRQRADITDDQFKEAIAWLDNGGTKKGACDILGVSNNKTMESRIEEWKNEQEIAKRMRREKRRTAITDQELANMIEDYFDGETFDDMSRRFYRSVAVIKHRLYLAGALIRTRETVSPLNPPLLPEEAVLLDADFRPRESVSFVAESLAMFETEKKRILAEKGWKQGEVVEVRQQAGKWRPECRIDRKGEIVWLPGYQCLGEIVKPVKSKAGAAFQVYLLGEGKHGYVNIMYWDIGSLRHLELLGANITSRASFMNGINVNETMNAALKAAKKSEK